MKNVQEEARKAFGCLSQQPGECARSAALSLPQEDKKGGSVLALCAVLRAARCSVLLEVLWFCAVLGARGSVLLSALCSVLCSVLGPAPPARCSVLCSVNLCVFI